MKNRILFLLPFLFVITVWSCADGSRQTEPQKIVMVFTNDMHAHIDHFPLLASFVGEARNHYPDLLLLDGGDRVSGNPFVDQAKPKGYPMISLMNDLGYDLAAMGNHDFDYGETRLRQILSEEAEFPVICANVKMDKESEVTQPKPYKFLTVNGVKICVLSFIQVGRDGIPATNIQNLDHISFVDFEEVAQDYRYLDEKCDLFIALTHLGVDGDKDLAELMPELDLIIGAHSHTYLDEPIVVNGVNIVQAGCNLNTCGVATFTMTDKKVTDFVYSLKQLKTYKPDSLFAVRVEEFCNQPYFLEVVGEAAKAMRYRENVASMATDAMCDAVGADFAFYNSGGIRISTLPQGPIRRLDLYDIEPFDNYVVTHRMTGAEMKQVLMKRWNGLSNPESRRIDLYISRGTYTIRVNAKNEAVDVEIKDGNGKHIDNDKTYTVAFSNYVSTTYDLFGKSDATPHTDMPIVKAMEQYLNANSPVTYTTQRAFVK